MRELALIPHRGNGRHASLQRHLGCWFPPGQRLVSPPAISCSEKRPNEVKNAGRRDIHVAFSRIAALLTKTSK
jgi:hypothetical protein